MSRELIEYDWTGVQLASGGLPTDALETLAPALNAAREQILGEDLRLFHSGAVPADRQPLDAGFLELPLRILSAYRAERSTSELGRILATAERLREVVDRVVLLGIGGSYMGARALMEACVHPYHNELSRGARGAVPRLYFAGENLDNDAVHALLDLLPTGKTTAALDDQWGIVVISKSGGTLETAVAFRIFLRALREHCQDGTVAARIVPVTGGSGRLRELARAIGCSEIFDVPEGVGGRFSILSAVGLLPAAILGLDVVQLLEGACAMNDHFRSAPSGQNLVLQFAGVCHRMEIERHATIRVLAVWSKALEAVGFWYDQLLAESLGKQERGATPITVVNTRDLHSRAQQHQQGARDKLITNLIVKEWRSDPLPIGRSDLDQDRLNSAANRRLPELMDAAIAATDRSYHDDHRPTATIALPRVDEYSLGQLFQMLMLATVVEGKLMGVNPYGQPGVEGYKRYLNRAL